ncbi:MAG TPA: M48 family metalloprotease [Alphaproteobacteria bacterium]|mgnify:CR=1 FL=1|nr:M48 family metalloprotease [Alphaproteobacteria bacterium]
MGISIADIDARFLARHRTFLAASYASCVPYLYAFHGQSLTRVFAAVAGAAVISAALTKAGAKAAYVRHLTGYVFSPETLSQASQETHEDFQQLKWDANISPHSGVYIYDEDDMNAFAGSDHVYLGSEIESTLEREQTKFVMAHETDHLRWNDTVTTVLPYSTPKMLTYVYSLGFGDLLYQTLMLRKSVDAMAALQIQDNISTLLYAVPAVMASLVLTDLFQRATIRSAEYRCDANGVLMTKNPEAAKEALIILSYGNGGDFDSGAGNLFATHPDLKRRVANIDSLELEKT